MTPAPLQRDANTSFAGPVSRAAVLTCAVGFFMRLFLSEPLLNLMGIDYGSESAGALAKVHPGSYFILVSFLLLLIGSGNPIERLIDVVRRQTAFSLFLAINFLVFTYWALRGPKGIGMMLDTHLAAPICAIVFCYAPRVWVRGLAYVIAGFAVLNSLVGLGEAATHSRIFPFDSSWEVVTQDYFRASAFLGHPLTNALFTSSALFIFLSLPMRVFFKNVGFLILLLSLVAFGGRAALIISVGSLTLLGLISLKRMIFDRPLSVFRLIFVVLTTIIVPLACATLLYVILHSGIGERLMAYSSGKDESANVRLLTLKVFDYLSFNEILFGIDGDRINQVSTLAGVIFPASDIENPWILLLMYFGAIMFALWLLGLAGFIGSLISDTPLALKLAVIDYFLIASSSNSFGRKDPAYVVMIGFAICAKQLINIKIKEDRFLPR